MRFWRGSKVEVLSKREVPSGSWWPAEIISGNGHTYHVKYDHYPIGIEAAPERVPRKAIRPCPPSIEGQTRWLPGDVVEVLDNQSWKLAEVLKSIGLDHYVVRPLGSCMELNVHSSKIRMRQTWQDNNWVLIQKDSRKCSDGMINMLPTNQQFFYQGMKPVFGNSDGHINMQSNNVMPEDFTKCTNKRMQVVSLIPETWIGARKKIRRMGKAGSCQQLITSQSPFIHEKVDAVASPHQSLGEKYMHASLKNKKVGFSETCRWDAMTNSSDSSCFRVSEHSDTASVCSSVGSCSAENSQFSPIKCPINDLTQELHGWSDDAVSSWSGREPSLPGKEAARKDVHQLELHAYRTTLLALYASGPISWEREALMTDLRCTLHISNDEHLVEVRNLVSAEKEVSVR